MNRYCADYVEAERLTAAVRRALEQGESRSRIARDMGWFYPDGKPDRRRLRRTLAQPGMARWNALKLARVIGRDPVDFGL